MEQRKMALVSLMGCAAEAAGTTPLYPPFKGGQGAHLAVVPTSASGMPHATDAEDAVHLRLLEEKAKNHLLGSELAWAKDLIRAAAEEREAMRRVCRAALKLLGWLAVGVLCGGMAVACWCLAPKWTCIAPAVLMGLAWWRAGKAV